MEGKNIDNFKEIKPCKYKDYYYLVRDNGAVYRLARTKNITPWIKSINNTWTFGRIDTKGTLSIGNEVVHRIVAKAFLGTPIDDSYVVLHLDGDKYNNSVSNLKWVSKLEYVLSNEGIRKAIEDDTSIAIKAFIENPNKYKELIKNPELLWIKKLIDK